VDFPDYPNIEKANGLPAGVLAAVVEQESSGNPWAARFEPGFSANVIGDKSQAELGGVWPSWVSDSTERTLRATSFGLMQILGQVARERGFRGAFLTQLCDPTIGVHYGALHLSGLLAKHGNLPDALSAYNAGTPTPTNRTNYVEPILQRMGVQI
jgi:Transglycosylase SLT domain